jgi:RNase adapter protein RapZ
VARAVKPRARDSKQLVILTGLSGSGKSTVLKTFEDLGYYCVDNLPVELIPTFSELHVYGNAEIERAALLVDAREGDQLKRLPALYKQIRREMNATLVFIEANEEALLRRFSETRRPHPLGHNLPVREGLSQERELMVPIRKLADVVIDTTRFNVHELRHFIEQRFQSSTRQPLLVSLVSFGYRYGLPADADLVFDVRFLPNPHFIPRLRKLSGKNPKVARYIRSFKQTGEFLKRIDGMLTYLIPHYIREGKSYLTIAFGCTGGHHRSVMMAEALRRSLGKHGYTTKAVHRDLEKFTP